MKSEKMQAEDKLISAIGNKNKKVLGAGKQPARL